MPTFQYEAAYTNGEHVTGVVEALTRNEAVVQIRQNCDVVISLTEVQSERRDLFEGMQKVDAKNLSLVCRQFSIILKAGLPLVQTVDLVAGQTADKMLKKILQQVSEDVSNGWSMSYSFEQRGKKLPTTFMETVRAGEESGDLVTSFERMSTYYDRMAKTKSRATSALMYPSFVIVVAVIVVGIIMVYAIPTFSTTFESLGAELPGITKALITVSDFMVHYIWVIILVIAGTLFAVNLYGHTEAGRERLSRLKLTIPVVGKIGLMAGASQFAHTMSTMLAAGMPIIQAIEVSGRSMTNDCMSKAVLGTVSGVESGKSLGDCMNNSPDLPEMLVQMTAVGEATGSLEATLEVMAEYYDNEVDTLTARALGMLEPIIICVLAVFVVIILLAVYLPMFSMYGAI